MKYTNTPFDCQRNRLGLHRSLQLVAHWLSGTGVTQAARETKVDKGVVTNLWRKCRALLAWKEQNRPKLENMDCIIDLTWGPHRRVEMFGAPCRPRHFEGVPFQVVVGYQWVDGNSLFCLDHSVFYKWLGRAPLTARRLQKP